MNDRYTEKVIAIGKPDRTLSRVVPAMRSERFNFSSTKKGASVTCGEAISGNEGQVAGLAAPLRCLGKTPIRGEVCAGLEYAANRLPTGEKRPFDKVVAVPMRALQMLAREQNVRN
jgi:hypothetical protein